MAMVVQRNEISKFKNELNEIYEETKKVNISVLRRIFDETIHPLTDKAFYALVNTFYIAQSYVMINRIIGNSLYLMSERKQRETLSEYVDIMDAVIDVLLFGIYPRESGEPKCFSIFSDSSKHWSEFIV